MVKYAKPSAICMMAIFVFTTFFGCYPALPKGNSSLENTQFLYDLQSASSSVQSTESEMDSYTPKGLESTPPSQSEGEPSESKTNLPQTESTVNSFSASQSSKADNQPVLPQGSPASSEISSPLPEPEAPPAPSSQQQASPPQPVYIPPSAPVGEYIVGYYASWSRYNGYRAQNIDASKLTHINYAFANISSDCRLIMGNPDADLKNFEDLQNLKSQNSSLKNIISVGGWDYSKYFSNAALTASSREIFAQSCIDFILEHGFDGIDLDWEYPVSGGMSGNSKRAEDKQNFTKLLMAIREKLNEQSQIDGRQYFLTIAGAPTNEYINKIELSAVISIVDYIFIMGYDLHGPWDKYADFNAPLYSPQEASPQYKISVAQGITNYLNHGAPSDKLVLGMPFYGYRYEGTGSSNNGLYSTFSTAKSIAYNTIASNYLNNPNFSYYYHNTAQVPYLFGENSFITYENAQSIAQKAQLAQNYGLAGVGIWELSQDKSGALLSSAYQTLQ